MHDQKRSRRSSTALSLMLLLVSKPDAEQALLHFVDVVKPRLVNLLLNDAPNLSSSELFGGR